MQQEDRPFDRVEVYREIVETIKKKAHFANRDL